ncbi:hypothetical protein SUGI_0822030 [Cryptomeria japonica]|uniref:amino acid transporter AVT3A n=1 Tax=Cryptomeria japonica TaxID=3369 RepID=UPI0024148861|nr:amino acid transporter AVT3A [Cryptomeria japonica]GLJ40126.1 hypothetical protein SUGI_0822030 [Cryptomeria japonica]
MAWEKGTSSARENTPLLPNQLKSEPLSSSSKSFGNILIAIVGAGVLGLPYTFMKTGWLAGIIILGIVAGLTYYCMMLLVWTKRKLEKEGFVKIGSFGDVGFIVSGPIGKGMVDSMIVLSQAGFCVSYFIFVANTLSSLFFRNEENEHYLYGSKILGLEASKLFIWAVLPFQLGLNAIRTLTHLAPFSIFADVVEILAMVVLMIEDVVTYVRNMPYLEAFTNFSIIPYGVGVAVYAFEGIGMVLPLETVTDQKHRFGGILGLALIFITAVYGAFGLLGYLAFGSETKDIITLNFGKNLLTDLVQVALSINLFFSLPLMMNPVHEIVESRLNGGQYSFPLRALSVSLTSLVAFFVPNFSDFLSLVGSSVCSVLGFVLPAIFHLLACRRDCSLVQICVDILIIFFGVVFGVAGTISSVKQIFFADVV